MKSYGPGHGHLVTFILTLFIKISMRYQDKCVNESEHLIAEFALGDDEERVSGVEKEGWTLLHQGHQQRSGCAHQAGSICWTTSWSRDAADHRCALEQQTPADFASHKERPGQTARTKSCVTHPCWLRQLSQEAGRGY